MIRSLWTGAAGMVGHQLYLDVLGNNVGNLNTIGFRKSAPRFEDLLSETQQDAVGSLGNVGGCGPLQVGHGTLVRAVDVLHMQGSVVTTGDPANMAIEGNGYFIVREGQKTLYSRAGNFDIDANGNIVQPGTGAILQGVAASGGMVPSAVGGVTDVRIPTLGSADYTLTPRGTGLVRYRCNLDSTLPAGDTHETSVDVYDSLGNSHALRVVWNRKLDPATGDPIPNVWEWQAYLGSSTTASGSGEITFRDVPDPTTGEPAGTIIADGSERPQITLDFPPDASGVTPPPGTVTLDFGGDGKSLQGVTQYASASTTKAVEQDGYGSGTFDSFTVTQAGVLLGHYSNDQNVPLYRLPLGLFRNPMGLSAEGGTNFTPSQNSGDVRFLFAGDENVGTLRGGAVEMSNVDLPEAFTELIVAQRSYQASARIVSTSDRFLQVSIELRR